MPKPTPKKKQKPTQATGASLLASRFIAHAKRQIRNVRNRRAFEGECNTCKAASWEEAIRWMKEWDTRAQAKPGGLGRVVKPGRTPAGGKR